MSFEPTFAGIDIGGTNVKYGLISNKGEILFKEQRPTMADKGPQPLMHLIANIGERLLLHAAEEELHVKHIGVGSPGAIDSQKGTVIGPCPNIEGWVGMEIGPILKERLNLPVYVDNDVHAMAIGETYFGAARGARSVVCAAVGTGIGGAVIQDGKLIHGSTMSGGELGHMTINFEGPVCACGNNGCIEAYCSSKMIIESTKKLLKNEMTPIFQDLLNGNLESLTIKKLFAAAKKDDEIAIEVINNTARYLGIGLAGIVNLLNPEIVVIGGGITDGGAGFVEKVDQTIREHAFFSAVEQLKILPAALGNDAGFTGAGLLGETHT